MSFAVDKNYKDISRFDFILHVKSIYYIIFMHGKLQNCKILLKCKLLVMDAKQNKQWTSTPKMKINLKHTENGRAQWMKWTIAH